MTKQEKQLKDFIRSENIRRANTTIGKNQKEIDNQIKKQFSGKK